MVKSQCAKLLDIVTLLMKQTEEQPQTERDLGACQDGKLLIMDMKDGIRQQSEGLESLREATTGAKTELDSLNLTLQNLLYEKSFYETEIRKCQDFRSAYSAEDISLIPLEDYRSLTGDAEAKEDHETMLKRLSHEIQRRKDLHARLEEVKKQRAAAEASEAKQRAFLSELSAQLKGIGKAAEGVRGQVEVRRGAMASAGSRADLLPMPLYILYSQLVACVDAHGLAASVAVEGSAQEAEAFHEEAPADQNRDCGPDARAEADGDIEMMEAEGRRGGEAKPGAKAAGSGVPKRDLYQKHPLSVVASLLNSESDSGTLMAVVFHYLPSLNIITAEAQDPADNVFLANLFPGDTGAESPNEANNQLQGGAFKFDMTRAGRPYRWAQHLAGLDFLPAVPSRMPEGPSAAALSSGIAEYRSQARPAVVLSTLRQRKEAAPSLK
uniref:THO complex subunit 5 n=1 Tax=Tetraselmis sp. GSL018 TaxID=582737 RepID=A0A061S8A7_9CHLO|mmetsp:Transcript_25626/g.60980  ORF Transcript_25626/g.60980 Transcript_25626/m.60980 type:complete len:439 (-) Transcript_25626:778-2094(-)